MKTKYYYKKNLLESTLKNCRLLPSSQEVIVLDNQKIGVRALTLVNILQMSWNWYMLFISDIAWTVLKMVYIRLMVCLQRHTKVFRYITAYGGGKSLKRILTHLNCTKYNEINIRYSDVQKHVSHTG